MNGRYREIFSIAERNSGDLILIRRAEDNVFHRRPERDERSPLVEEHISVHRSINSASDGTTIKCTRVVNGSQKLEDAAFVKGPRDALLWPVLSAITPDLRIDKYEPCIGPNDQTVLIGAFDADSSSLAYHVLAVSKRRTLPGLPANNLVECEFRYFKLAVYANYINMPSHHAGFLVRLPTRAPIIDGSIAGEENGIFMRTYKNDSDPLMDSEIDSLLHTFNQDMYGHLCFLLMDQLADNDPRIDMIGNHDPVFSQLPITAVTPVQLMDTRPEKWVPDGLKGNKGRRTDD